MRKSFFVMIVCCSIFMGESMTTMATTPINTRIEECNRMDALDWLTDQNVDLLKQQVDNKLKEEPEISEEDLNEWIIEFINHNYVKHASKNSNGVPYNKSKLNKQEKKLFAANPAKGVNVLSAANMATKWAQSNYNSNCLYQGNGDAYRHSFWQAVVANEYGSNYAKQWGDAHESESPNGVDKSMDLLNNEIGRSVGTSIKGNRYVEARISKDLMDKISNGKLWRIINNCLCHTDASGRK